MAEIISNKNSRFIALQLQSYGEPSETILAIPITIPSVQSHEILVELVAAPLNPHDLIPLPNGPPVIEGLNFPSPAPPKFLGGEGIAKVVEIGDAVTNVKVGEIVDIPSNTKTWAERMVYSAENLRPLPKSHLIQLSFYRLNPIMAYVMLKEFADLEPGSWIVQNAANSSIGQYVIQFAKIWGYKTINIVRREEVVEELKILGADHVLVDSPNLINEIEQLADVDSIKLALEAVGGDHTNKLGVILSPEGTLVTYGSALKDYNLKINRVLFFIKQLKLVNFYLGNWNPPKEKVDAIKKEIVELITNGELKTKIDGIYPLREHKTVFNRIFNERTEGKIVFIGPGYN